MDKQKQNGVELAIDKAGSQDKLADRLGVSQQVISKWKRRGYVPLNRAVEIETQYGIKRAQLINPRIADLVEPDHDA